MKALSISSGNNGCTGSLRLVNGIFTVDIRQVTLVSLAMNGLFCYISDAPSFCLTDQDLDKIMEEVVDSKAKLMLIGVKLGIPMIVSTWTAQMLITN